MYIYLPALGCHKFFRVASTLDSVAHTSVHHGAEDQKSPSEQQCTARVNAIPKVSHYTRPPRHLRPALPHTHPLHHPVQMVNGGLCQSCLSTVGKTRQDSDLHPPSTVSGARETRQANRVSSFAELNLCLLHRRVEASYGPALTLYSFLGVTVNSRTPRYKIRKIVLDHVHRLGAEAGPYRLSQETMADVHLLADVAVALLEVEGMALYDDGLASGAWDRCPTDIRGMDEEIRRRKGTEKKS